MTWVSPWGTHWKTKNLFEVYFVPMVEAAKGGDLVYFNQLRDELLEMDLGMEKYHDIWFHMASDTRAKVKGND